jgi:hypothetical protein
MIEAFAWRVWDVNYVRRCIIRLCEWYSWLYPWRRKRGLFSDAMRGSRLELEAGTTRRDLARPLGTLNLAAFHPTSSQGRHNRLLYIPTVKHPIVLGHISIVLYASKQPR